MAQAPHVRCSQAAAAVGDDVFYFGGSFYKCAGAPSSDVTAGACLGASSVCLLERSALPDSAMPNV